MPLILLGLLLMAATAAFTGLLIAYNSSGGPDYTVNLLGEHPFTLSMLGAFAGGLGLALIFGLGAWLLLGGGALAAHRSKKRHAARHEARQVAGQRNAMANRLDEREGQLRETEGTGGYAQGGQAAGDYRSTGGTRPAEHAGSTSYGHSGRRRPVMAAFHRPHARH